MGQTSCIHQVSRISSIPIPYNYCVLLVKISCGKNFILIVNHEYPVGNAHYLYSDKSDTVYVNKPENQELAVLQLPSSKQDFPDVSVVFLAKQVQRQSQMVQHPYLENILLES